MKEVIVEVSQKYVIYIYHRFIILYFFNNTKCFSPFGHIYRFTTTITISCTHFPPAFFSCISIIIRSQFDQRWMQEYIVLHVHDRHSFVFSPTIQTQLTNNVLSRQGQTRSNERLDSYILKSAYAQVESRE